jgi:hypothetical protein
VVLWHASISCSAMPLRTADARIQAAGRKITSPPIALHCLSVNLHALTSSQNVVVKHVCTKLMCLPAYEPKEDPFMATEYFRFCSCRTGTLHSLAPAAGAGRTGMVYICCKNHCIHQLHVMPYSAHSTRRTSEKGMVTALSCMCWF